MADRGARQSWAVVGWAMPGIPGVIRQFVCCGGLACCMTVMLGGEYVPFGCSASTVRLARGIPAAHRMVGVMQGGGEGWRLGGERGADWPERAWGLQGKVLAPS